MFDCLARRLQRAVEIHAVRPTDTAEQAWHGGLSKVCAGGAGGEVGGSQANHPYRARPQRGGVKAPRRAPNQAREC